MAIANAIEIAAAGMKLGLSLSYMLIGFSRRSLKDDETYLR
jgi:hypothetical protein